MEINEVYSNDSVTVHLKGNIDEHGAETLKARLNSLKTDGLNHIKIDCSNVSHIGSAGIGKFLLLYKNFAPNGGQITVSGLSSVLKDMFINLKLDSVFKIE